MKTKICSHCYKELPLTEFGKDKSRKDGLSGYCKICANEASRKSQAKAYADPIKRKQILEKVLKRCHDPNNHDRILETDRKSKAKARRDPIKLAKIREAVRKSCAKAYADPIKRQLRNEQSKKSYRKRYTTDPEFREYYKRNRDKRRRNYNGIRLAENIIDEPVIRHHVNDNEVIDVPYDIHVMYPTYPKEVHRFMVNQIVEQIYGIKIKEI